MMFVRAALIDVGLTIQLGHADGSYCSNPVPPRQGFCVVDTNGHHTVAIEDVPHDPDAAMSPVDLEEEPAADASGALVSEGVAAGFEGLEAAFAPSPGKGAPFSVVDELGSGADVPAEGASVASFVSSF